MNRVLSFLALAGFVTTLSADEPKREKAPAPKPFVDTTGYRTTKDALRADPSQFATVSSTVPVVPGFLGIELATDEQGRVVVDSVLPESPADVAGVEAGDLISTIDGTAVKSAVKAQEVLQGRNVGDRVSLALERKGSTLTITPTLIAASKPLKLTTERPLVGVQLSAEKDGGVTVTALTPGGSAEKSGVKVGDFIQKINETTIDNESSFRNIVGEKRVGETVVLKLLREKTEMYVRVTLTADNSRTGGRMNVGWDDRRPNAWSKPTYKLAILGIEYPDVKHNPKIADDDWQRSLFSLNEYNAKSATGQKVHGSMNDYYQEISAKQFKVDGNFLGWVEVSKKRMEYSTGSGTSTREKSALLVETFDKFLEKKGKNALDGYDGVFFLFAGERVQTTRGGLYWPHRANFRHNNKSWPYFIVQEGGPRMTDISVFCHEFGHMLGLPDLYARPEVPGMEGVGVWCAMSQQLPAGRPQHFSAWCKQELGWLKPVMIDPRVKQKLVLAPISDNPGECFKIPVRPDGSEYFLLENRRKVGFDSDLPAEGLLIWRVIPGRGRDSQPVFLEEAHGVQGAEGPRTFSGAVPFPNPANTSFTPNTIPSSKSQLGGGYEIHITNIRRLRDGKIAFQIGYEFQ